MAASAAITLAVKAATDKRARPAIASVVIAVFLPFILMTFIILSALDGTSTHNFSAVDLSFHGGTLSEKVPEEYREYIEDIRKSFQNLDSLIAGVDDLEGGEIDASRVKAWFYALYFGEVQPSRRAQKDFLECFLRYEERTREVEEEDGSITEETYTVAIFLTDQEEICRNLESLLGGAWPWKQGPMPRGSIPQQSMAGWGLAALRRERPWGTEATGRCSRRLPAISVIPMCGAALPRPRPLTAAGISAGSTHSPVSTTCQGQQRKESITSAPSCPVKGQGPVT